MQSKWIVSHGLSAALALAALTSCQTSTETKPAPTTQPMTAVDLHNTICPVSGDAVADSHYVEVYNGKVYHLCCSDCPTEFEKDPAKYEAAVAANPEKYGIK
jgi:YHS domain-containing protein